MNRNIYRDNYERDYWQDYDAAENEVAKREKKLTRRQIRIYHKNVSKERAEIEVPLSNRSEGR
jgi:hypothetical protein